MVPQSGNTRRSFDLETNRRVAEFSFIDWKGCPESMRKKQLLLTATRLTETNVSARARSQGRAAQADPSP